MNAELLQVVTTTSDRPDASRLAAAVLEKRESSVRSLLHRARELLRKSYGADLETERGRAEIG